MAIAGAKLLGVLVKHLGAEDAARVIRYVAPKPQPRETGNDLY